MTLLTHDRVVELVGPLSDDRMARILECQAREEDLLAAISWIEADDGIERETHRQPDGKVARLCEILAAEKEDDDAADRPFPAE